jgi:hypothetical protein
MPQRATTMTTKRAAPPPPGVEAPVIEHDARGRAPAWEVGDGERRSMISEAAYYRAVSRGFEPGHELEDWLAAEAEIDALLEDRDADPARM